jgi:predicted glutamine amidotransferase
MCAIIGWQGHLPRGFLSRLIIESGSRGKDSTGVAFYGKFKDKSDATFMGIGAYKDAVEPIDFIQDDDVKKILSDARRSPAGIAHTRRASPGMPINSKNAHPFPYWNFYFAHNGRVENWKALKETLVEHFKSIAKNKVKESLGAEVKDELVDEVVSELYSFLLASKYKAENVSTEEFWAKSIETQKELVCKDVSQGVAQQVGNLQFKPIMRSLDCAKYASEVTTDSQVLGPFINARDFRLVEGCMALVWIKGHHVYTMRYGKEAISAKITWRWKNETKDGNEKTIEESTDNSLKLLTLVASTREIVNKSLNKLNDAIEWNVEFEEYSEGRVYRLDISGLVDEGAVEVYDHAIVDEFSSQGV